MKTSIKIISKREELISEFKGKVVIIDEAVYKLHPFLNHLDQKKLLIISNPEKEKTFEGTEKILHFLLENAFSRDVHIVAIGGGALSDLVGFAASIYKRGVKWSVVPTTILSLIDASIGGKTAINSKFGKNLIGSFYHPETIYVDYEFFKSLPKEEIDSGHGELLKYAFLSSKVAKELKKNNLKDAYIEACKYKQKIVKKDPFEKGERKLLNLGHTIGHAIEAHNNIPHGICVLIGLKTILKMYRLELIPIFLELQKILKITEPIIVLEEDKIDKYLTQDKKISGNGIDLIIPKSLGKSEVKRIDLGEFRQKVASELARG